VITVEKALPRDTADVLSLLEEILRIHHAGRPDIFSDHGAKYTAEDLEKLFSDPMTPSFTVREDGAFRGYALCRFVVSDGTPPRHAAKTLYIDDLCVLSDHRGKGLGSAMIEHLKAFAKEENCDRVELNVWEFNLGAMKLYQRCGFSTQRRQLEIKL